MLHHQHKQINVCLPLFICLSLTVFLWHNVCQFSFIYLSIYLPFYLPMNHPVRPSVCPTAHRQSNCFVLYSFIHFYLLCLFLNFISAPMLMSMLLPATQNETKLTYAHHYCYHFQSFLWRVQPASSDRWREVESVSLWRRSAQPSGELQRWEWGIAKEEERERKRMGERGKGEGRKKGGRDREWVGDGREGER